MDTSDEVIRGLKALGETAETRDPWLIYILTQKLDDKSKGLWSEYAADMVNPQFSEFLKFLSRRIDTLESLVPAARRVVSKPEVRSHVTSHSNTPKLRPKFECAVCQKTDHSMFQCNDFHSMGAIQRKEFARKTNRCFNCLSVNHPIFKCPSKHRCQKCGVKHNTLLHQDATADDPENQSPSTSSTGMSSLHSQHINASVILPTAIISVIDTSGEPVQCRALLDSGSQSSFITESCVQRLGLKKINGRISISGIGKSEPRISKGWVTVNIKLQHDSNLSIKALVLPKITSQLPPQNLIIEEQFYSGIKLADPKFYKSKCIDVLIGADHFFQLLRDGRIKTSSEEPTLQNTAFGWIVSGKTTGRIESHVSSMVATANTQESLLNIDQCLRRFWEVESFDEQKNVFSPEETFCENHFTQNLRRDPQGRFVVQLPFKQSPTCLGDSLPCALQRLRGVERRLTRDPNFAKLYQDFMTEYEDLQHMVEVPPPKPDENHFYLPHHGVLKITSSTSKLRVVFDGSAKSSTSKSLNDCLAVGPNVQSSLYAIILRFREHKFVFSADIEKMYRQVGISYDDSQYQRIVWRSDPSQSIRHYRLTTVTYGLASAPFLATRAIKQVAEETRSTSLHAANVIDKDIYVDDIMTGGDNEDEVKLLKETVTEILSKYGFQLRKWKSNSPTILCTTAADRRDTDHKLIQEHSQSHTEYNKVLGINWNPENDRFMFTLRLEDSIQVTKRSVLPESSRLFDPLGWLAPVVITFKIFLQMLWGDNLGWDDPLPLEKLDIWRKIKNNLKNVNKISIPRFLGTVTHSTVDIHGFCDASQYAYAAVIYFRILNDEGQISVQLITSKTKVAPIKQLSLPRLELCAAVLLTGLIRTVKCYSNVRIRQTFTWTDSQIVLDWLADHPRRWSTFVGNRTAEILSHTSRKEWNHVASADNPADCASRGLSPSELQSHHLWWNGPTWLHRSSEAWPAQLKTYGNHEEESNRRIIFSFTCTDNNEWYETMLSRYSSFSRLQRVMGYLVRFIGNASKPKGSRIIGIHLKREELFQVVNSICQYEQRQYFQDDIHSLQSKGEVNKGSAVKSLDPFLDDSGTLRVGGRLHNSLAPYSTKHPIIIHFKSKIAYLILRDIHLANKHAGPTLLISISRQEFWIPNGKTKAKEVIKNCITCVKFKTQCQQQLMGNLPSTRVELIRPFLTTGVDYAGPILIHLAKGRGQKVYKSYICLFICLSTKAVHLELVSDLSSDSFLSALKRFTARRGVCRELLSNNGTNFIGADRKLQEEFQKLIKNSSNITNYISSNRITWTFIPPHSPHFGGLWEAAIKSTKFHLKRVIGKHILTLEEMNTLLAEIESILNSRPLCTINNTEVDPLTPSHFLIGHSSLKIPAMDITHLNVSHLSRWQLVQQISQHFWKHWYTEYLTSLQQGSKWRNRKPLIQIDDVVLIKEQNVPVNQWPIARVQHLHPGSDGIVRVVTLKYKNTEIKRPIHKLCVLPVSEESNDELH